MKKLNSRLKNFPGLEPNSPETIKNVIIGDL